VAASVSGDAITNTGTNAVYLRIRNASGGAVTVTADSLYPCEYNFDHNAVATVDAGTTEDLGPLPRSQFGASVAVTYSAVSGVTVYAWTT
jgi:hypothetical protein